VTAVSFYHKVFQYLNHRHAPSVIRNTIWARVTKSAPSTFMVQDAVLISHESTRRAWRLIEAIGLYGLIFHWV